MEQTPEQRERAASQARALGLERLALEPWDGTSALELGSFDYVLVPDLLLRPGGDAALALREAKAALGPQGVAFVAYPSASGRALRDRIAPVLMAATSGEPSRARRVERARAALALLAAPLEHEPNAYSQHVYAELARAARLDDDTLLSDYLSPRPVAFDRDGFASLVHAAGLRVIGDLGPTTADPRTDSTLRLDFARHVELPVALSFCDIVQGRDVQWVALVLDGSRLVPPSPSARLEAGRLIAPLICPEPDPWLGPRSPLSFYTLEDQPITYEDPVPKAALLALSRAWPAGLSAAGLKAEVDALLEATPGAGPLDEEASRELALLVHEWLGHGLVRSTTREVSARAPRPEPVVDPLTRLQAERGPHLTGPHHDVLYVDPVERLLIGRIDGRTVDAIREELRALLEEGTLVLDEEGAECSPETALAYLDQRLSILLLRLHHLGALL